MNKHIKLIHYSPWLRRAPLSLLCGASLFFAAPFAVAQDSEEDSILELSPFVVDGSDDQGYRATSTLAGTRIRTDLKDVGSAISVVTEEFLRDTNATDNETLLVYTTNMEVGGTEGNFAGGSDSGRVDTDSQRKNPNDSTRVRGLAKADNTRSFYRTDIPWDSYNVKRIDIQRGPNSILFGLGSPAGVINANVDQAYFNDGGDAEIRFDDHGTVRMTLNYNKVLIEDELAVRFATLQEDEKFQ
ncbi:MAG: TonB-dependent receptor plug domain-containing protein, partial [Verrucomicrobiota bacterium]